MTHKLSLVSLFGMVLLCCGILALAFVAQEHADNLRWQGAPAWEWSMTFFLCIALIYFINGLGLFFHKAWARIPSILSLALTAFIWIMFLYRTIRPQDPLLPTKLGITVFVFAFAAFGILFLHHRYTLRQLGIEPPEEDHHDDILDQ